MNSVYMYQFYPKESLNSTFYLVLTIYQDVLHNYNDRMDRHINK